MTTTKHIAQAIRNNSLSEYQDARYDEPNRIEEAEIVRFVDEDFSGANFAKFVMGFFRFDNCKLDRASHICGQPIYFLNSSIRDVDFRRVHAMIYAENCDFTGIKVDDNTTFVYSPRDVSEFVNCIFDDETREFLVKQGAIFRDNVKDTSKYRAAWYID